MKSIPKLNKINNGQRIFYNPTKNEKKIFFDIKIEIEKKYGIRLASREQIIKQLIETLTHGDHERYFLPKIDLRIIRSDIKNFFPSVNKHSLYKKISQGNLLSLSTVDILKPMFFSNAVSGIPLGLPFSNALSEVYLENFDQDIRTAFNPIFYFRYVDDIIIINYNNSRIDLNNDLNILRKVFKSHSLLLNETKTEFSVFENNKKINFDYLGYHFTSDKNKLSISISESKFKKIADNIKRDFYNYKRSSRSKKQFWILYYKVMNRIYGVTSIDKYERKMQFGLGFTYRFINDDTKMLELLNIVKGLIFSCKFSSYQCSTLLSLISYEKTPLELLSKRYDYTRLTQNQFKVIKNRLNLNTASNNISRIFFSIYK
ncbi:RNA-directed DNA polymerase [Enterococcus durans]|uniref:RNA-directed DNA polymerase n=1 Tax=Enterococcus durans TaxID=53345 RepID=UPI001883699D|nr:RNA-directed DNA polymerase [Enterococcus durans]MBE9887356.1 RNA-directed DNA polymerase [Enterococcus durans]